MNTTKVVVETTAQVKLKEAKGLTRNVKDALKSDNDIGVTKFGVNFKKLSNVLTLF